jgi:hypothetical protein
VPTTETTAHGEPDRDERAQDESEEPGDLTELPRTIWLLSENRRTIPTILVAIIAALIAQRWVLDGYEPFRELARADALGASLLLPVMVWAWYALVHVVLTLLAYRGLRGTRFAAAVTADPSWRKYDSRRRSTFYRWFVGVGPSSWAITFAFFALIAVVLLVMRPTVRELPLALVVALVLVATAWLNVAVSYAVHYARVDITRGGLAFPGEGAQTLLDYLYLAAGVQATFGTTDVEIRSRELRTQVLSQSILAFVFNTVIIGMVISLLLGAA